MVLLGKTIYDRIRELEERLSAIERRIERNLLGIRKLKRRTIGKGKAK